MKLVWILGLAACGGGGTATGPTTPASAGGAVTCTWHDDVVGKAEALHQTWVALPKALAHAGVNATGAALLGLDGKPLGAAAIASPPLDSATVVNAGALIHGYFAFVIGTSHGSADGGGKPTAELARFDATGAATGPAATMVAFPPELGAETGKQLVEAGNCFALLTDKDVRIADGHGKPVGAPIAHGTPVRVARVGDVKSFRIAVQWDASKVQVFDASTGDPIADAVDTGHDLIALVPMGAASALAIAAKDGLLEDAVVGNDGKVSAWHTLHQGHRADNVIVGEQPGGAMLIQFTDDQAYAGQIRADGTLGPLSAPGPAEHQSTFGIVGFDGIYDQDGTDIRRWTCD